MIRYLLVATILLITSCKIDVIKDTDRYDREELESDYAVPERLEMRKKDKVYEVLATDNLDSIAGRYGVSREVLIRKNRLKSPYRLKAGQIIKIPVIEYYEPDLTEEIDSLDDKKNIKNQEVYIVPKKKNN